MLKWIIYFHIDARFRESWHSSVFLHQISLETDHRPESDNIDLVISDTCSLTPCCARRGQGSRCYSAKGVLVCARQLG